MQPIQEEPEDVEEENFFRSHRLRESLSAVQPTDRIRSLGHNWAEYAAPSGRLYYCNSDTNERTWKPPRKLSEEKPDPKTCSLPHELFLLKKSESECLCDFDDVIKLPNIGKILRTGMLKTTVVEVNGEKMKKKKWVKSFVVLTEFFILLTTVLGSFRKLFKKTKTPKPSRYYLYNAEVIKDSELSNVYRLKTFSKEILFKSKNATAAESWYQAITMVVNNLKESTEKFERFDVTNWERTNSFDFGSSLRGRKNLGMKSVSLSDFSFDGTETDSPRGSHLSDSFGAKYATPPGWITIFDAETQQFCYVNCITKKKWFRAMTEDGHPYFYEEDGDRRAWLLPSIYLDVNSQILEDPKKSNASQNTLNSIT